MTTAGAVLVAVLALATEGAFALTGRLSTPKTESRGEAGKEPERTPAGASVRRSGRW